MRHVFALDKDSGQLLVLSSPVEAPGHCKPVDVQDGFWFFFAEDGSPLEPRFDLPDDPDELPGPYSLERAMSGLWLQERLALITSVNGGGLTDVDDVAEMLRENRARRAAGQRL
ncbi:MAG TPA: hypothetical protein VM051_01205 [Usitatibacter sp.]|nr:hypothetical protein [Usitatibacter sp.]